MRVLVFMLLFPLGSLAQDRDSVLVSTDEIIKAAETIEALRDSVVELNGIIVEMQRSDRLQSMMYDYTTKELELMNQRVNIADGIINRYSIHVNNDSKFVNSNGAHLLFGFAAGLGSAYLSSYIYNNIK
jgi:hypothetical protein